MAKAFLVAGLALALGAVGPAGAEPTDILVVQGNRTLADNQRAVPYGDLQLASEADQRVLRERIGLAISELCDASRFSVSEPHGSMECRHGAWKDVRAKMPQRHARLAQR